MMHLPPYLIVHDLIIQIMSDEGKGKLVLTGDSMYRPTFSRPRHYLEVSGQRHVPATLPPGTGFRFTLNRMQGGHQRRSGLRGEEKILVPTGIQTPTPRSSSPQPVVMPTVLSHLNNVWYRKQLRTYLLCNFLLPSNICSPLGSNITFSTLLSHKLTPCFSLSMRDRIHYLMYIRVKLRSVMFLALALPCLCMIVVIRTHLHTQYQ
jgi:hypothetical protein